jgi:DNA-directed RNA polymerase subunit RPC12/RpoP
MSYRDQDEEWDDEEADYGDDSDDGEPSVRCPYCRRDILEDSLRCPYCERYISEEDRADVQKPLWVLATALICLGIAIWWVFVA